jgi:hypothetical protein
MMLLRRSLALRWPPIVPSLPIALCFGLGGVIYIEAQAPSSVTARAAAPAPAPLHQPQNVDPADPAFTSPPLESLAEVVDRPLFAPARRTAPPPTSATSPSPTGFALVGVVLSNGAAHALIEHGQPERMERLVEGEDIDGWSVESIRLDRVVLRRAELRADLRLADAPSSTPPHGEAAVSKPIVPGAGPAGDPAADHEIAVQVYMDAHGGMLPAEAQ